MHNPPSFDVPGSAILTTSQRLLLSAVPVVVSASAALAASRRAPPGVLFLVLLLAGLSWYSYLRVPRVARLRTTCLHCETPLGSVEIALSDIEEIDVRRWSRGFAAIRTRRRTVFFLRKMPGLLGILSSIASSRSGLSVRGELSS